MGWKCPGRKIPPVRRFRKFRMSPKSRNQLHQGPEAEVVVEDADEVDLLQLPKAPGQY